MPLALKSDRINNLNILVVEHSDEISKMLAFFLESQFGVNVFEASDSESAIHFLSSFSQINLVILGDFSKSANVLNFLKETALTQNVYIIISSADKSAYENLMFHQGVLGLVNRKNLISEVSTLIKSKFFNAEIIEGGPRTVMCRIHIQLLLYMNPLEVDLYIKISEDKYLVAFKKGDKFEEPDFEKYKSKKKINYLYVRENDKPVFYEKFKREINRLVSSEETCPDLLKQVGVGIHSTVYGMIQQLGVTEEVKYMTKTNVSLILKRVGTTPHLSEVYKRIQREASEYIVTHSFDLAEVSCILASHISWVSDITFKKLIVASLFHDITIKNHELAKISSLEEAKAHSELFVYENFEDYRAHPIRSADLVKLLDDTPADVDLMIRQHHERSDGTGFPAGINSQKMAPLGCLMIIAGDYIDYVTAKNSKPELLDFIEINKRKYSGGHFSKILRALSERIRNK